MMEDYTEKNSQKTNFKMEFLRVPFWDHPLGLDSGEATLFKELNVGDWFNYKGWVHLKVSNGDTNNAWDFSKQRLTTWKQSQNKCKRLDYAIVHCSAW